MNISPYRTRDQHIPVITRTSPTDSADGFMTVFGEIKPNQISKRCSSCGIRQPLSNFFKKAISKLKKSQQKNFNTTLPENYRSQCCTCHEKGLNR